jgi:hypothetical protein
LTNVGSNSTRQFSGHVYDLQTESSLYICNGLISSNCRHVLIPYVAADDDEEERLREFSNSEKITSDLKHYQSVISGRSKGLKSD